MNKLVLIILFTIGLFMVSCKGVKKDSNNVQEGTEQLIDSLDTLYVEEYIDDNGSVLSLSFNDDASEVVCVLDDLKVLLREQAQVSEMRYINDEYELIIWQGVVKLKKGKDILFIKEPKQVIGKLTLGHEASSFVPCGEDNVFWVIDNTASLENEYEVLTEGLEPYTPVFVRVSVIDRGQASDGFAKDYDGVYEIVNLIEMKLLDENTCK